MPVIPGESLLPKMVSEKGAPHYSIKVLDLVLICIGHYDYEIAEITFNLWYCLSEELYQKNDDQLSVHFRPHIERLIGALFRHAQMEPDHEGLIEEDDSFSVSIFSKAVVWIQYHFLSFSCRISEEKFLNLSRT